MDTTIPCIIDSKKSTSDTGEEISTTVFTVSTTVISTTASTKATDGTYTTISTDTMDVGSATDSIGTGDELTLQQSSFTGDENYLSGAGVEGASLQTTTLGSVEGTTTDFGRYKRIVTLANMLPYI